MSTGFFNTSAPREREPSRPRHVNPRTGVEQSWQRASNFAAPLDNPFGLKRHHGRQIVRGFNLRNDLARMALTGAITGDKVDETIATAITAAEDEAKANNGSAVHAALELCDTGKDVPQEYWPHARGYVAELKRWGLRPVAVEQSLLNTRLGAKGKTDRVYVTDSGRYLVGDIKTGSISHPHTMAVQCEVYAGSDFVIHPDGTAEPIPWKLDQDAALIIHVDPDTGATAVYEVPLRVARWGSALAEQVRAFQRADVLLPYSGAPTGPLLAELHASAGLEPRVSPEAAHARLTSNAEHAQGPNGFESRAAYESAAQAVADSGVVERGETLTVLGPNHPAALVPTTAGAAPVTPSGVVAPAHVQPAESSTAPTSGAPAASPSDFVCRYDGKAASAHPIDIPGQFHCISPVPHSALTNNAEFVQPERPASSTAPDVHAEAAPEVSDAPLTDAEAQQVRKLGLDLSAPATHHRRMLRLLVTKNDKAKLQRMLSDLGGTDLAHHRKWLAERIISIQDANSGARAARPSAQVAQTIEQGVPAGEATPFMLKQIADAATVADIKRIRTNIISMSGEAAWSQAMDQVAAARIAELDGPRGDQVPLQDLRVGSPLTRIADAKTTQDLAQVWEDVTRNGAEVNAWTPAYDKAARKRGEELQAGAPANPNPWGSA